MLCAAGFEFEPSAGVIDTGDLLRARTTTRDDRRGGSVGWRPVPDTGHRPLSPAVVGEAGKNAADDAGGYRSGQTGQTVNLMAMPSQVRILYPPLKNIEIQMRRDIKEECRWEGRRFEIRFSDFGL